MTRNPDSKLAASFRDPSGFLFTRDGRLFRQVNQAYAAEYDRLMGSGLYQRLVERGLLIAHREVDDAPAVPELAYRVIEPQRVGFISYPYEWSFSQLQDAALTTLAVVKEALEKGMVLKDASAYNIQFHNGRPVLIDTLSFESYNEGQPWTAYRQFCQHFLAPLALMAHRDVRLSQLLRIYIDGVPLDLASELLPSKTRLSFAMLTHIHAHAASQKKYAGQAVPQERAAQRISKIAFLGLIDSLESAVKGLNWQPQGTEWADYYDATNYTRDAFEEKKRVVTGMLQQAAPQRVWDLGANNGVFSRLAADAGIPTVAFDIDPAAVEQNYRDCRKRGDKHLLPLVMDLTNPSPALGWDNRERDSLAERGPADTVMALALIHHLAIANNVPLAQVATFFARLAPWLIIEFVPKSDSQVQRLLASRVDIFTEYNEAGFEAAFGERYVIRAKQAVSGSQRVMYLMERKTEE